MDRASYLDHLRQGLAGLDAWQRRWPAFERASELELADETVGRILEELVERLHDNYPFFHPRYAGQMLKPPHAIASLAYALAMQINPNNHALDGGPATAGMEREAVGRLARMVGYDEPLGHLTSSGTLANLEALWVARSLHPGKAVAFSSQAHYTHRRMAEVLGMPAVEIAVDDRGRLSLEDLEHKLAAEPIGTVVATAGTTGLGAVDPVDALVAMASERGFRVHVDAAYGGFYRILAGAMPSLVPQGPFTAIARADSVVIDPHKHGLQPYGCGSVLFRDPSVGRFYRHESPYTYFTSAELHLGEISLECSRAGAAAAALWATLQAFPLELDRGFGPVLRATREAALDWAERLRGSDVLALVLEPELDILAFYPLTAGHKASEISAQTDRVFAAGMSAGSESVYLAKLVVPRALVEGRSTGVEWDRPTLTVLRSCLMKPEHRALVPWLHARVEALARTR